MRKATAIALLAVMLYSHPVSAQDSVPPVDRLSASLEDSSAAGDPFAGVPIPIPGACCRGDACVDGLTQAQCVSDGCGMWIGADTECALIDLVCPARYGACCANGECRLVEYPTPGCPAGTFLGCGTGCINATTCPAAVGACCVDGVCQDDLTQAQCINLCGEWHDCGTTCAELVEQGDICPDPEGVCCVNGVCDKSLGQDACECSVGGVWVPQTQRFVARLTPDQENGCAGVSSPASGDGAFDLDPVTGVVTYTITFTPLTSPESDAHVHGPAPECVSAGAIISLPPGSPKVGSYTLTSAQQADMMAGRHYVNIHSVTYPLGEIRGQIMPEGPSDCATIACPPPPTGACCVDSGCTLNVTEQQCEVNQCGTWKGPNSTCGGAACPTLIGVCCLNGACNNMGQDACQCAGGSFVGNGNCTSLVCPGGSTGACCVDGACVPGLTREECMVDRCGAWGGAGSNCGGGFLCAVPAEGVCCVDGSCREDLGFDSCDCAGGTWVNADGCASVTCPEPRGRCCYGATCTNNVTEVDCGCGLWGGQGSTCTAIIPDEDGDLVGDPTGIGTCRPRGACCRSDQTCAAVHEETCACEGGTWYPNVSCNAHFDCNGNGILDFCEGQPDCDNNGVPDTCEPDCNANGRNDVCDIASGDSADCNDNRIPDECDIASGSAEDCNQNGRPDDCDLGLADPCDPGATSGDCNGNEVPDECEIDENSPAPGGPFFCQSNCADDCNDNGVLDVCELNPDCAHNAAIDCNFDERLNACDPDCQGNGQSDVCELIGGLIDCAGSGGLVGNAGLGMILHNGNCAMCHGPGGIGGTAPYHRGYSRYRYQWKTSGCVPHVGGQFNFTIEQYADLEAWLSDLGGGGNGVPDGCESPADCDGDGTADVCMIAAGLSEDCNDNDVPDECDLSSGTSDDCNHNDIPDECEALTDCNRNGIPDVCEGLPDCNGDGIPDICDPDCDGNGQSDVCQILGGAPDCNGNGVLDACEPDCNGNGVADECDITSGTSTDLNENGIPDDCEADCNGNAVPDDLDLAAGNRGKTVVVDHAAAPPAVPDCEAGGNEPLIETVVVDFGAQCGAVQVLRVAVRITHTWVGDLVIQVESPSGTIVTLVSRAGLDELDPYCGGGECCGIGSNDVDAEFSDEFAQPSEGAATLAGALHPSAGATGHSGDLSTLAGEPECGPWTLRVYDGSLYDDGALTWWRLDFRADPVSADCNKNSVPDECDIGDGDSADCDANGVPDECEDCDGNGLADACDFAAGADDCNANGQLDICEGYRDCNTNGTLDECDIASGTSDDCNGNGAPDECDLAGLSGLFVTGVTTDNVTQYDPVGGDDLGPFVAGGAGGLDAPWGLTFSPWGNLLVAGNTSPAIREYDGNTGAFVGNFVTGGPGPAISQQVDLAFGPNGNLFVLTVQGGRVHQYDKVFGAYMGVFAQLPPGPVNLPAGYDMVFMPGGDLLIGDYSNHRIMRFNGTTGASMGQFNSGGSLNGPIAMAFDAQGRLYVASLFANNVQRFSATGQFVDVFIPALGGSGQLYLGRLAFGPDGDLFLTHALLNVVVRVDGTNPAIFEVLPNYGGLVTPLGLAFRPASADCNANAVPDDCEDCNDNLLADVCDIAAGTSEDVNGNNVPDECEGPDVSVVLVVRKAENPSAANSSAPNPPRSAAIIEQEHFFDVEVWATDRGPVNTGLEQVYVNLTFPAGDVYASTVTHYPPFTTNALGGVDNTAGAVYNLGGRDAAGSGVGIEPEWRRIAGVRFEALHCTAADFGVSLSLPGITAVNRGIISDGDLSFEGASVDVSVACVYDLDGSGLINAGDLGMFSACWLSGPADPGWNPRCDFDCSGFVDAGDMGWLAASWLSTCANVENEEVPECRRCENNPQ